MLLGEVEQFAVVRGGQLLVTASLGDHAEAVVAVVDVRVAHQQVIGGGLRLVELAGADHVDDRVGCLVEAVVGGIEAVLERVEERIGACNRGGLPGLGGG